MELREYIIRHKAWSEITFGPGQKTNGLTQHIAKELEEIKKSPNDIKEWIDVIILALDGAWRAGYSPDDIERALWAKQWENMDRKWPAPHGEDKPTEHIRD